MQIATGERSAAINPTARALLDQIGQWESEFGLFDAHVFFDFPLYRDDERLIQCQFLLLSDTCGIVLAGVSNVQRNSAEAIRAAEVALDSAFGQLMARLVKNPNLRKGRGQLRVGFDAFLYAPDLDANESPHLESFPLVRNGIELHELLAGLHGDPVAPHVFDETLATIEGAKGLLRPKERDLKELGEDSKAVRVAKLEEEINRFDRDQVEGYLPSVEGVQRIRGLAGSGKTVVLAMRAALLHLRNPEDRIAVTFHTRSLYQHVKRLITRFYRQYDDRDPDWEKVHVLHAWGGTANPGIYSNACINNGVQPLTYKEAAAIGGTSPFDAACSLLLNQPNGIRPEYDDVLVDEAQDFPASFLRLCHALAKRDRLVYAYDQLQTIFQAEPPSIADVFGTDKRGEPIVKLRLDTVLHKCYRNPLEITVCAHALGFGIYGDRIVQMLENEDHWKDLGYEVLTGSLVPGALTKIRRSADSSPSSISAMSTREEIVSAHVYTDFSEEIRAVVQEVTAWLNDESFMQFRLNAEFSYSYYESPVQAQDFEGFALDRIGPDWQEVESDLREEYEAYLNSLPRDWPATPIRFDYSPSLYRTPGHPAAHMHFGFSSDVRVATRRIMSPEAFVLFIVRQCYPERWGSLVEKRRAVYLRHHVRDSLAQLENRHWSPLDECEIYLF